MRGGGERASATTGAEGVRGEWDERLIQLLRAKCEADGGIGFFFRSMHQNAKVREVAENGDLVVELRGAKATFAWARLSPADKRGLAFRIADSMPPASNAVAAYHILAAGGTESDARDQLIAAGELADGVRSSFGRATDAGGPSSRPQPSDGVGRPLSDRSLGTGSLIVYEDVPGLEASDKYALSVRTLGGNGPWQSAFAFITRCKDKKGIRRENNYFGGLSNWSNTYINIEMVEPVEVEIRNVDGQPIRKAVARPRRKARSCAIRNGKAYVTIEKPCLLAVDIDGQMEDQDTGKGYKGPPIHTVTIFANPVIENRPQPDDPRVHAVRPGEQAPHEGPWETLYFLPGVHDIGVAFPVHANRRYYIPGDALVYGTMNNHGGWTDGHHIRIFGYGTLSGAKLSNPKFVSPPPKERSQYDPIFIVGATNTSVEGITLADSAFHSLMLISPLKPDEPTDVRWVKIFTWRANGDGINPFGNGLIEDCFIRTQDDSTYVNGRGIRRVTFWNDANGSAFVLSALPNRELIVEDCDVIYARAGWHRWSGGRLFNMRGEGGGDCGAGVVFRNIRVEDPRPTLQHFMIAMQGVKPYSDPQERRRGAGDLSGVLFQNIDIAAPSVLGEPEILWGAPDARIVNVTFDNVTIGGKKITSLDDFKHNEHVQNIRFK